MIDLIKSPMQMQLGLSLKTRAAQRPAFSRRKRTALDCVKMPTISRAKRSNCNGELGVLLTVQRAGRVTD
jgi:hypothetical protein